MFNDLPDHLKLRVHELLKANDFPSAKEIHDNWMLEQHDPIETSSYFNQANPGIENPLAS